MRSTHDSNLENKRFIFLSCKERRGEQEGGCRNEMESEGSSKKEKKKNPHIPLPPFHNII